MKPSFGTDFTSFLGVALGAAAGMALTAALVSERSTHASHEDIHYDGRHSVSVVVGYDGKHKAIMDHEVTVSKLLEAELEAEKARLEEREIRLRVEPRVRVERRERVERRR